MLSILSALPNLPPNYPLFDNPEAGKYRLGHGACSFGDYTLKIDFNALKDLQAVLKTNNALITMKVKWHLALFSERAEKTFFEAKIVPLEVRIEKKGKDFIAHLFSYELEEKEIQKFVSRYNMHPMGSDETWLVVQSEDLVNDEWSFQKLRIFCKAILKSIEDPSCGVAASNFTSLIVKAGVSLSDMDLSNLSLKDANLTNGIFNKTILNQSNMQKAQASNTFFAGASFIKTDLTGFKFDSKPFMYTGAPVNALALSSQTEYLAGGVKNLINIWELNSLNLLAVVSMIGTLTAITFDNKTKYIAGGDSEGNLSIWEVQQLIASNRKPSPQFSWKTSTKGCVTGLQFLDDLTLCSTAEDGSVRFWRMDTNKNTTIYYPKPIRCMAFSKDHRLVFATNDTCYLLDVLEKRQILSWKISKEPKTMQFSANESLYVLTEGQMHIFSIKEGIAETKILQIEKSTSAFSVIDEDTFLLTSDNDGVTRMRSLPSGNIKGQWIGSPDPIQDIKVSSIRRVLFTAQHNNRVGVFPLDRNVRGNVETAKPIAIAFHQEGKIAWLTEDFSFKIFETFFHKPLKYLEIQLPPTLRSNYYLSSMHEKLIEKHWDLPLRLWDIEDGALKNAQTFGADPAKCFFEVIEEKKHFIGIVTQDEKNLEIWNVKKKKIYKRIILQEFTLTSFSRNLFQFSPKTNQLIVAEGQTLAFWSLKDTPTIIERTITSHQYVIDDIIYLPKQNILFSLSQEKGGLKIWNMQNRSEHTPPFFKESAFSLMNASKDGAYLAVVAHRRNVYIWDILQQIVLEEITIDGTVLQIQWSSDHRYLALITEQGRYYLWEVCELDKGPIFCLLHVNPTYFCATKATAKEAVGLQEETRLILAQSGVTM